MEIWQDQNEFNFKVRISDYSLTESSGDSLTPRASIVIRNRRFLADVVDFFTVTIPSRLLSIPALHPTNQTAKFGDWPPTDRLDLPATGSEGTDKFPPPRAKRHRVLATHD
jgi:hypothetical protein